MISSSSSKADLPVLPSGDAAAAGLTAAGLSETTGLRPDNNNKSSYDARPETLKTKAKEKVLPVESTVAGAVAGLVSRFVIAPLDVVKIRLQLEVDSKQPIGGTERRIYNKLKSIAYQEGFTALFKGNVPAEILYIAYGAAQFTTYKWTSNALAVSMPETTSDSAKSFIAGATSACVATTLTYPFDLLRTRFAVQATPGNPKIYNSLYHAIRQIYASEGISGYYRGLTPAVMTMVPYMGIFFTSYEKIKNGLEYVLPSPMNTSFESRSWSSGNLLTRLTKDSLLLALANSHEAIAGLLAGVLSKTALFPFDVVRKRLQVQGPTREKYLSGTIPIYPRNPFLTAFMIVQREGILGLYKGLFVSIIKSAPASAVTMWTFGNTLDFMRRLKEEGLISY